MELVKLYIVALFGIFLLNPDVQYAATVPAPASPDNGVHSNLLQNINPFSKFSTDDSPFNWQKTMGGIGHFFGNVVGRAKTVIEEPLKKIFQQNKPQSAGYADTIANKPSTSSTTTTTTTTSAPQDNRDIISRIIDAPSSQKSASSQIKKMLDNTLYKLFERQRPVQTTTTTTTTITTTLARQSNTKTPITALMSNTGNLFNSLMSLIKLLLAKNGSFELGSIMQHSIQAMGNMKAISDIFLQKDMTGGIGRIGVELKKIISSIKNITDIMSKPGDFMMMLSLPGYVATLTKSFIGLKDDLLSPMVNFVDGKSNLSSLNIPKEFVNALESIADACNSFLKLLSPPRHIEATNDIHSLANHTAGLVNSLSHIEDMVEKQFPKFKFPMSFSLVKLQKIVQLLFANDTLDDKNILKVIETILSNTPITKIAADFGNMIKKAFPNMPAVESVAEILQNDFLVNMLVNIMGSSNLLQFGPLKDSMLQVTGNVGTRLLKMDKHGLIVKVVQLMEDYSTIFEKILRLFQNIVSQLKPDPKKRNPIGQVLTNIPKALINSENRRMFMHVIYEINLRLPHNVLFRFIKGIFDYSFILKPFKYLLTGGPIRDLIVFIWRILLRIIRAILGNEFISKLKYWLTLGPIRDFIAFIWRILVHKKNN